MRHHSTRFLVAEENNGNKLFERSQKWSSRIHIEQKTLCDIKVVSLLCRENIPMRIWKNTDGNVNLLIVFQL
jgi:cell division protein FtsL